MNKDEPATLLPDGSTLRYREDVRYPTWMEAKGDLDNRILYAALAHAHKALSSQRYGNLRRFAIQLELLDAALDAALEVCGVERGAPIPLPKVEPKR
jgi:hypothetical protein